MSLGIAISISITLCFIILLFSYLHIKKTYDAIDKILDDILNKNTNVTLESMSDNRLSKLSHKAEKIIKMNIADISQIKIEKDIIQSFLSDMSHQMKTPLSVVSIYTDLLLEGDTSVEEKQEFLTRIKKGTGKLQWMMDSLVKMSRLEVGAIELSPTPTPIKQTITDSINDVYTSASKKNISIQTDYFEDILLLHDRKWTCEAITNILENAIKYSLQNDKIKISVESFPIYTRINITDYGIGIAPEEWNSIFKRFYRGKNAKDVDGAGLGLYLSSLIFQKQGGYIHVNSSQGKCTTFSVFLQNCKK